MLYPVLLLAFTAVKAFLYPIVYSDSDLWIHLSDGRYFFEHLRIPNDSYFSFIDPPRVSPNFRWLFQALIYAIFTRAGYFGLILLRGGLYVGTSILALRFLFRGQTDRRAHVWLAFIGALMIPLLIPRYLNVRPHMFDYFFIPAILYLLELKKDKVVFLPLVAIAWCNLHGVAYPVLLLICGSYALEYLVNRWRGHGYSRDEERRFFLPLALSMLAIYLTPHGVGLLGVPFRPYGYLSTYIMEMAPLALEDFTSLSISGFTPTVLSLFNLFLAAAVLSAAVSITKRSLRLSHLLLFAGGVVLLARFNRFMYEFMLLSLPLLRAHPVRFELCRPAELPRWVVWIVSGALMVLPFRTLNAVFTAKHAAYPLSIKGLPEGVTTFLRHIDARGRVLSHPNPSGYWRWMVYPACKILLNLDFLFRDEDLYLAREAFSDAESLRKIITQYEPAFISVPLNLRPQFAKLISAFPEYRPVFFDDAELLYADQRRYPAIVRQYEIKTIDSYGLFVPDIEGGAEPQDFAPQVQEARRLLAIYPKGRNTNLFIGMVLYQDGAYDRVLDYAETAIHSFPEDSMGHWLKGDAYRKLQLYQLALTSYKQALAREDDVAKRSAIWNKIGNMYLEQHAYTKAYRAFIKGIPDIFSSDTPSADLYRLGTAALHAGKEDEAYAVFSYLKQFRLGPKDVELSAKVEAMLGQLDRQHPVPRVAK